MATPDYPAWDMVSEFEPLQAAFLWLDIEPETAYRHKAPPKVQAIADTLTERAREQGNTQTGYLSRESLVEFAKSKGVEPPFLFPETRELRCSVSDIQALKAERDSLRAMVDRMAADNAEPDPRHRKTLLRIIGALLELAKIDPDMPAKTAAHAINSRLELKGGGMKADVIADNIKDARRLSAHE